MRNVSEPKDDARDKPEAELRWVPWLLWVSMRNRNCGMVQRDTVLKNEVSDWTGGLWIDGTNLSS